MTTLAVTGASGQLGRLVLEALLARGTAASDIVAGTAPKPDTDVAEAFRQSSRTAAMIAVYERVLG